MEKNTSEKIDNAIRNLVGNLQTQLVIIGVALDEAQSENKRLTDELAALKNAAAPAA